MATTQIRMAAPSDRDLGKLIKELEAWEKSGEKEGAAFGNEQRFYLQQCRKLRDKRKQVKGEANRIEAEAQQRSSADKARKQQWEDTVPVPGEKFVRVQQKVCLEVAQVVGVNVNRNGRWIATVIPPTTSVARLSSTNCPPNMQQWHRLGMFDIAGAGVEVPQALLAALLE
jgi:hypothetical protein